MILNIIEPTPITNIICSLKNGGNLNPNTTYYVTIISSIQYNSTNIGKENSIHSAITPDSSFSFTTDSTHLSVDISWDGGKIVDFLMKLTPGNDWSGSSSLKNSYYFYITNRTFTISEMATQTKYMKHSAQLMNPFYKNIDKNLSSPLFIFTVENGDNKYQTDLYNEIVNLGYGSHVWFDGFMFVILGKIIINSNGNGGGTIKLISTDFVFLHGSIYFNSTSNNNYIQIGYPKTSSNELPPSVPLNKYSCNFYFHSTRYIINSRSNSLYYWYGGIIDVQKYRIKNVTERINNYYYNGNYALALVGNFTNFYGDLTTIGLRSNYGTIIDKPLFLQINNFSQHAVYVDSTTTSFSWMAYGKGEFYRIKFTKGSQQNKWFTIYASSKSKKFEQYLYDCDFGDHHMFRSMRWYYSGSDRLAGSFHFMNSLRNKVLDENGLPIQNVKITGIDSNGNNIMWFGLGGERKYTDPNKDSFEIYTDENGETDYYIESVRAYSPGYSNHGYNYDVAYKYLYPLKIKIEKNGFEDRFIIISNIYERTEILTSLPKITRNKITNNGNVIILNNPKLGIKSNITEI